MTFPDTTFVPGTTITSNWLNAVNDAIVDGSANINYTPPFTNAITTTVGNKLSETISVKDFGAVGDGVTDDTTAIQAAATAASGMALYFPSGNYALTAAINLPSNIRVYGDGIGLSTITASGTSAFNLFNASDKTNIAFDNLSFYGNSVATSSGNGQAIRLEMTAGATFDFVDATVDNCRFDNFKGDYWVLFYNANASHVFKNIRVANCIFQSYTGNARNGSLVGVPSICISISGTTSPVSSLTDIVIKNNIADCYYIKTFLALWSGVKRAVVTGNIVKNAGVSSEISDNVGAYAFLIYDSTSLNVPNEIICSENIIDGVRSCGFYCAAAQTLQITNNRITNQTDTVSGSLPKGGIVLNGCSYLLVENNFIESIAADGIYWVSDSATARESGVAINNNKIKTCLNGIHLNSAYQNNGDILVNSNDISVCTYGVVLQTYAGVYTEKISIVNNNIGSEIAGSYGIELLSGAATYDVRSANIQGNTIKTVAVGISWQNVTTGSVNIENNYIVGDYVNGLTVNSSTFVNITNNTFANQGAAGYCLVANNAQGNIKNNTFVNCSSGHLIYTSGTVLGYTTPAWTPSGTGYFVQNVIATEAGTAGSKYVNQGWYYTGSAWVEQRALTGN